MHLVLKSDCVAILRIKLKLFHYIIFLIIALLLLPSCNFPSTLESEKKNVS